jgi:predicted phosphohydrolase
MAIVQVASDLHLEFFKRSLKIKRVMPTIIQPAAPVLILAGDIFRIDHIDYGKELFDYVSKKWERVFFLCGNHEFYGSSIEGGLAKLQALISNYQNVFLLNNTSYDLCPGYRIVGGTMWSHIHDENKVEVFHNMNDYVQIEDLSTAKVNRMHQEFNDFLASECKQAIEDNVKLIVATHHAPLLDIMTDPIYRGDKMNDAYCSDMSAFMKDPVVFWCSGHTHFPCKFVHNDQVFVYSNPRGYPMQPPGKKFRMLEFIDIENELKKNIMKNL